MADVEIIGDMNAMPLYRPLTLLVVLNLGCAPAADATPGGVAPNRETTDAGRTTSVVSTAMPTSRPRDGDGEGLLSRKKPASKPYFQVNDDGDAVLVYVLYDLSRPNTPVVIVRPAEQALTAGFERAYRGWGKALKRKKASDFRLPVPHFRALDELSAKHPNLDQSLSPDELARIVQHLENVNTKTDHGHIHRSDNEAWLAPAPYRQERGVGRGYWTRADTKRLPDPKQLHGPTYNHKTRRLTYFTTKNASTYDYGTPRVTHYLGWQHTIDCASVPWKRLPPVRTKERDVGKLETAVIDAAFGGAVNAFMVAQTPSGRMLVNIGEPTKAKRFVLLDGADNVVSAHNSLQALWQKTEKDQRAAWLSALLKTIGPRVVKAGRLVADADAWRSDFGQQKRVRIGAPMFTLHDDLSEYETVSTPPLPPFADAVHDPTMDGDDIVAVYLTGDAPTRVSEVRVNTRTLTVEPVLNKRSLGVIEQTMRLPGTPVK